MNHLKIIGLLILIILIIFIFLHYKKYKQFTEEYEIEQQELDYVKGPELNNLLNPLVITYIEDTTLEDNAINYGLYSPLSISDNYEISPKEWLNTLNKDSNIYVKQKHDIFLIRPKKEMKLLLINPKYNDFFNKIENNKNGILFELNKDNYSKVQSIEIIIRDHNILYIPRHWIFKIDEFSNTSDDKTYEIFYSSSVINNLLFL